MAKSSNPRCHQEHPIAKGCTDQNLIVQALDHLLTESLFIKKRFMGTSPLINLNVFDQIAKSYRFKFQKEREHAAEMSRANEPKERADK